MRVVKHAFLISCCDVLHIDDSICKIISMACLRWSTPGKKICVQNNIIYIQMLCCGEVYSMQLTVCDIKFLSDLQQVSDIPYLHQ